MNEPQNIVVQVSHRFAHPAEHVFDAWLDVGRASRFMFSTETGDLVRCEIDPRVGGEFVMTDRRPDGDVEHRGRYLEIERPRRIVFTFGIPAESPDYDVVTIEIEPVEGGCELTLTTHMKPEWADYAGKARDGWAKILVSLDRVLGVPDER
jgi:uncharacterized protein YndB with AHSA1/START domain